MVSRRALWLAVPLAAIALPAHAQTINTLDAIVQQFQTQSAGWGPALRGFALNTFSILAMIEIGWSACRLAMRTPSADFSEWQAEALNQVMFVGFFLLMLQSSTSWMTAIVDSFRQAAGVAGGGSTMTPSAIFAAGVSLAGVIMSQMSVWSPSASVALVIAGLAILLCFALIAAFMILALVESYLIINAGVIFMAFGGSRWTKEIAISTVRAALGIGAKLFILQLLVSIGAGLIMQWAASFSTVTANSMCILLGCAIVLLALVKTVPDSFQRMVGGVGIGSGSALVGAAAAVGGGAVAAGAGLLGSGAMAAQGYRLASAQMSAAESASGGQSPQSTRIARAAALTGGAVRNVAMASARDVGRKLRGDIGASHGSASWRMGAAMGHHRRLLADDANKPKPPQPPTGAT